MIIFMSQLFSSDFARSTQTAVPSRSEIRNLDKLVQPSYTLGM